MAMSSRFSSGLVLAALAATACAPDNAAPGYDDPFLSNFDGAPCNAGSSSTCSDGPGGSAATDPSTNPNPPPPTPSTSPTTPTAAPSTTPSAAPSTAPATTPMMSNPGSTPC